MIFEGLNCGFREASREYIEKMSRSELEEWLEFRGFAVYDDESTSLLRETALEDYEAESV
tara:strand:- start:396 stop:575 length:180 start_codon:yes stop_codon:yes gene_type:complete